MNDKLSIKQICEEYELSPVYVRRAISKGKLQVSERVLIAKNTEKILVERNVVEAWRKRSERHSPRIDGRNKYILYATSEELEALKKSAGLELNVLRANLKKNVERS